MLKLNIVSINKKKIQHKAIFIKQLIQYQKKSRHPKT